MMYRIYFATTLVSRISDTDQSKKGSYLAHKIIAMVLHRSLDVFDLPAQEVNEAVQRRDVMGVISCVQGHILKVLSQAPLLYDVQKHIADQIFSTLGKHSISIQTDQESDIRGLLQTVYHGMQNQTTRRESVERLRETGIPLLEKIFHGDSPVSSAPVLPKKRNPQQKVYSSENPPKIPDGFDMNWDTKKWRAFCMLYGYSPETNTFDLSQARSRAEIAKELAITVSTVSVHLSVIHQSIASWVPVKSSRKISKKPFPITNGEDISVPKGEEYDPETDEDEDEEVDAGDDDGEKEKGAPEIDVSDSVNALIRKNLTHTLLSPEEERELAHILEQETKKYNSIQITEELLVHLMDVVQFSYPRIAKKVSIPSIRRSVEDLKTGDILTGDLLISLRMLASECLLGNEKQKILGDTLLSEINGDITPVAQDAINTLVNHNLRFVFSVAKKFVGRGLDLIDLYQEGCIGLHKAATRFDTRFENKFTTYAIWWIRQSIRRAIANNARTIRIPINIQSRYSSLKKVIDLMTNELGHEPTNEEISEEVGIPIQMIVELKQSMKKTVSLDAPLAEGDDTTQGDMIADPRTRGSDHGAMIMDEQGVIRNFLNTLKEKERDILERRFGLNGHHPQTLEDVGKYHQVTRERIRQIERQALKKMRTRMKKLNPFIDHAGDDDFYQISPHDSHSFIPSFSDDALLRHIDTLSAREQRVLKAWCGLGQKKESLHKIEEREGMTHTQLMTFKSLALKKLPSAVRDTLTNLGKM